MVKLILTLFSAFLAGWLWAKLPMGFQVKALLASFLILASLYIVVTIWGKRHA